MQSRNIIRVLLVTGLVLMVPLVAMQFTEEVDWNLFDFIVMGIPLLSMGFGYELATRSVGDAKSRFAIGLVFLAALLLIWAELAVGIIGTPFAGS
jgi:hypothetical protein